ncbi:nucleoside phosphatase family-domain-containing protein [Mucidula mucida]|nr:nucleoside phosphatase family-domain-containing protein [Mucidula mucida]
MLSPRSANYERIEGGMGPSRGMPPKQRIAWTWKKFAIGAAVLIGLVYSPWGDTSVEDDIDIPQDVSIPTIPLTLPPSATDSGTNSKPPTHQAPPHIDDDELPSFDTDPNPSGTTHSNPTYEYEVFKMTKPGLSSYGDSPDEAAASLDVLLDEAMRVVPENYRKCAPVEVKATAGLRLLGEAKNRIETKYPFSFNTAEVMDGKDEGVYAWITANYLLGTLNSVEKTYAVLDLGGASTQIVFEPKWDDNTGRLEDGEHKYDLTFSGQSHVLYQHSYLGYGLMRARRHVHQLVEFMDSLRTPTSGTIANPCLAKGTARDIDMDGRQLRMSGADIGSFDACNRIVELVMAKDAVCEMKPCSFNGVYQPSLLDSFPGGKVLLLSYFFDRVDPLLPGGEGLTVDGIAELARSVCQGRNSWLLRWGGDAELMKELDDRPEWCLDLTFMHGLLQLGYEFDSSREVTIGKKIAGTELGWCLGATLAMIGGDLKCRQ